MLKFMKKRKEPTLNEQQVRHTLIINYAGMKMGGIERYLSQLMLYSVEQGYRVIWITTESCVNCADISSIIECNRIERCYIKLGWHWPRYDISLHDNEIVTMISCEPLKFIQAESFRRKFNGNQFDHFLLLPHFTGAAYYPERLFNNKILRKICYRYTSRFAKTLSGRNCIIGFSLKHIESYEQNYYLKIEDKRDKVLKGITQPITIPYEDFERKADERKNKFVIASCARLDFPHKGYLIGLIDCFRMIKESHPQAELHIVGDGPSRQKLVDSINKMPVDCRSSVVLMGTLEYDQLISEFRQCHMNIGLAGALLAGASCGLPSLVVRHYSYDCETYGYISDIKNTLSTDRGANPIPFIEYMIDCDNEKYILQSKADYDYISEIRRRNYDPEFLFHTHNTSCNTTVSYWQTIVAKAINVVFYVKASLLRFPAYE